MIKIVIVGKGVALAELSDENPVVAKAVYQSLPLERAASTWGDEVYFEIPLKMEDENPSPRSKRGDVSYWSPGSAFCIFFGETQPYSPVNHVGRIVEGLDLFKEVLDGDRIKLSI